MKVSVVICTYNRQDYLYKCLNSLTSQTSDSFSFEIIIIDNKSTDNTKEIALQFCDSVPNANYYFEPVQGLSHARNTGYNLAQGEVVAYLDDDAIASTNWIEAILKAFYRHGPELGVIGGQVDLIWEDERPDWVSDSLLGWLGSLNLEKTMFLDPAIQGVYGCNMAFSKSFLQKADGFNTNLGLNGKNSLTNEETDIQNKIFKQGGKILYVHDMHILHHAKKSLSQKWFFNRAYKHGISVARSEKLSTKLSYRQIPVLFRVIFCMLKLILKRRLNKVKEITYTAEMVSHLIKLGYVKQILGYSIFHKY